MSHRIVGILGGTFNPIHNGHIELAKLAHQQYNIPEILVMPTGDPSSYKDNNHIVDATDRCNMVLLAIKDYPYMKLSTLETDRPGLTYTSDTLKELLKIYDKIYFIIGADSLFNLSTWHEAEYVMSHCHLLAANRDNRKLSQLTEQIGKLEQKYNATINLLNIPNQPYSSTSIREAVSSNKNINYMVNQEVADYIHQHNLYI